MKRFRWIETALLILLLAVIVLCVVRLLQDDSVSFNQSADSAIQISIEDCAVTEESIDSFVGVQKTYSFELPDDFSAGNYLILHIMHQYCTVRIDGTVRYIYEDGAPRFIRTSGRYWSCVNLSDADKGKTVEIRLTPVLPFVPVPEISICPLDQMIIDTLSDDLPLLLLGLLCLALGLSLAVIVLLTIFDKRTEYRLLCLSMLTISAGIWKISSLPVVTLLLRCTSMPILQPKALYLYDMISFMLIPVFVVQFLNGRRPQMKDVPEKICAVVTALTAVVVLTLQLLGKLELQTVVPYLMAESALLMLIMFVLILYRRDTIWMICFPICACGDLLITYLAGNSRYAVMLILCILVNDYVSGVIFIRKTIRQKSELRDARAAALLNQIQPHFIHNTLASVYYLCDSDPQTAKQVVRDFNNHLRANFTSLSMKAPIPFSEELEHVRAYLSVEQVRFSDKLFVEYDTPHTAFRLPPLTLQPLVENAVKHNVDSSKPPVHICIRTQKTDIGSLVVIEDDGSGVQGALSDERTHVGLANVADRLQMLCSGTLNVLPRPDGGAVVTILIPDTPKQ